MDAGYFVYKSLRTHIFRFFIHIW